MGEEGGAQDECAVFKPFLVRVGSGCGGVKDLTNAGKRGSHFKGLSVP